MVVDVDDFDMAIDLTLPCGFILNELMSNALKHGFVDERSGQVRISIQRAPSGDVVVKFCDDGVGLPDGVDIMQQTSLGIRTIRAIAERQLQGTIAFDSDGNGLCCTFGFRDQASKS